MLLLRKCLLQNNFISLHELCGWEPWIPKDLQPSIRTRVWCTILGGLWHFTSIILFSHWRKFTYVSTYSRGQIGAVLPILHFFFCFAITLFLIIFIVLVYFALQFSSALNFLCFPYIYKHFHFVYQNDFSNNLVSFLRMGFLSDVFHCHDFFLSVSYSLNRYPNPSSLGFWWGFLHEF